MKDSLNTLKELASSVRNATKEGENSAERIGRLFEGILEYIKTPESIENYFELKQDSNGLDYIYTKYNIASAGALSMYASDKINVPSIYDGLPIDNDTIYWHEVDGSKVLKAKGGGGEAGSVQWDNISGKPSWIEDTKPSYSWSDITGEKPFYTKEEIASKYVTIDTEQEITALKHLTAGLSVGESKKKIYEENGVVYIDADVAVTGAMTFYATAGRTVSTIMDAVTVDGITIKKENNVLKAVSGAGSSFDENAMWSALSVSSNNQINKSHLTDALAGYATTEALNSVSNKLNDFLEGSDTDNIINKWKELEAFLSGMAETDNLAEILGTKADRSYVDSTFVTLATKQTITGEKTFSSVLNTAAIKASGAITTPSLAASDYVTIAGIKLRKLEDGALMLEGNLALTGALTMYASNGQSFDTIYDGLPIDNDTIYWQEVDGSRVLKAREGSGSSFDKSAMWTALAGSTTEQINKSHLTTALTGYATESWVTSKNYLTSVSIAIISDLHANWDALLKATPSSYVTRWPTISEVTDRKNLIIKLNGGSTEGTNLFTYNVTGEKTINITPAGIGAAASSHNHSWSNITSGKPTTLAGYGITDAYTKTESDSKYPTKTGSGASGTWGINVTGNAGTATKLQTARTLWGRSFDGTGNVSGNIENTQKIYSQSGVWLDLFGSAGVAFYTAGSLKGVFSSAGNFGIGTSSPSKKLDVNGSTGTTDLYINGIRLHKSADGVITLEGNLAVTGGITTYAIDPVSASTVMDGVAVDGTTITKVDGVLKVLNAGGGEAGSVAWGNITGKPSVFATNIANITDLHSSWDSVLAAQKPAWLTAVSIATISDLNSGWDALLKAAPSAYVTRWPTISEVTGKQNLIVKLNGGTTEGTNQFTYNATGAKTINITPAGIGAAASSHSHNAISASLTGTNALNMVYAQIADNDYFRLRVGGTASNAGYVEFATADDGNEPIYFRQYTGTFTTVKRTLTLLDGSGMSSFPGAVMIFNNTGKSLSSIDKTNGSANSWTKLENTAIKLQNNNNALTIIVDGQENARTALIQVGHENSNYSSSVGSLYLNKLGGDVYIGTTLAATVNSNVASATKLQTARTLWGRSFDGTNNVSGSLSGVEWINSGLRIDYESDKVGLRWSGVHTVEFGGNTGYAHTTYRFHPSYSSSGSTQTSVIIENASASNTPTFTRTHGFYSDGSSFHSKSLGIEVEATGNGLYANTIYAYKDITTQGVFTTTNNTILRKTGYANTDILTWVWNSTYGDHLTFTIPGTNNQSVKVRISAAKGLYVEGNITATGGVTLYGSDIRYKSIMQQVNLSLLDIAKAPSFVYRWNRPNMNQNRLNLGGSAQYTQSVLPWAVEDNDNFLSMDYATVAYTFAVHTARHLLTYESRTDKKIKKLEREIVILKKQLKKLRYEEASIVDDQSV